MHFIAKKLETVEHVLRVLLMVQLELLVCNGWSVDPNWVDIPKKLIASPNYHFMTMVRKTKTCDYYQCKMSCEEWLADEISILRYSTADEYCQCFRFPYMELYNYGEAPKVDEGEIYAVTYDLSVNVRPPTIPKPRSRSTTTQSSAGE